jgi:hypothetical protein
MTECIPSPITFSSLKAKKIQADFDGGAITSDAGAVLLREVDKRIGLIDQINDCIPDPRHPLYVTHTQRTMLAQRIMGIAQGYEDLNDHQTLREDTVFQVATDRGFDSETPLASTSTLWRLEDRVDREAMIKIVEVFVDQFIQSHSTAPDQIVLDFDATDDPLYGQQEGRFFNGYYDCYCYLPLYVFCGDQLLVPYLRPSNIDGAKHSWAILKLLVQRFRQVWPGVRIIFRGDSGFCRWKMMRWCDRQGVYYVIGLGKNPVLLRKSAFLHQKAQCQFEQTGLKQRLLGTFSYAAATWDRHRRVIARLEFDAKGVNPRFIVTNLPGSPYQLYYELYCARGDMENRIKEQQLWLFADRTSCREFLTNQFRLLLSSAAYILLDSLRRLGLQDTPWARIQSVTIRNKLLKIGARIVVSVRRVVLHLPTGYPYATFFREVANRLTGSMSDTFGFA